MDEASVEKLLVTGNLAELVDRLEDETDDRPIDRPDESSSLVDAGSGSEPSEPPD